MKRNPMRGLRPYYWKKVASAQRRKVRLYVRLQRMGA
jgi:hypothetical protein